MGRTYALGFLPKELRKVVVRTPKVDISDIAEARKGILKMYRFLPKPNEVGVEWEDLHIEGPKMRKGVMVRIYHPTKKKKNFMKIPFLSKPLPAMLFMHWGGFVLGDLRTEHARCLRLCREVEMVIVSVDYRLAPENPYPAGLDDCYAALKWMYENYSHLNIDRNKIAVGGTSAGGGLAAGLAIRARDRKGPPISMQYLGFPVLDCKSNTYSAVTYTDTPNWTAEANKQMWEYYLPRNIVVTSEASPSIETNLKGLPRTYIWTAEFDPLRDEAISYGHKLLQAGVPTELHSFSDAIHGFDSSHIRKGIVERAHRNQVEMLKAHFESCP
ncbi:MAG: alpha/beta hydrolase [Bacteroidota bacterium]